MNVPGGGQRPAVSTPPGPSRLVLISVLGLAGFASTFSMRLADPLVPTLAAEFQVPVATVATLTTAFGLSYAAGQPVFGAVGDAFGKARTITVAALILAVVLVVSSLVAGFTGLFVARCAAGIAAGGLIPVAMAAIADRVPIAERQVAIARFIMFVTLGQMVGAMGSGLIADAFGWRVVFIMAALVALSGALAIFLVLKPRPNAVREPFSLARAVNGYGHVFANRRTLPLLALAVVEGALIFGLLPFSAAILHERTGVGATEAGIVIAGSGFGAILFGAFAPRLVRSLGPHRMPVLGGFSVAFALTMFALPLPWWTGIGIFVFHGLGFMLIHSTLQLQATELAPENRGSAIAVFAASLFVGQAIGPLVMALLPHSSANPTGLIVFAVAAILLGFAVPRVLPQVGAPPEAQRPR